MAQPLLKTAFNLKAKYLMCEKNTILCGTESIQIIRARRAHINLHLQNVPYIPKNQHC